MTRAVRLSRLFALDLRAFVERHQVGPGGMLAKLDAALALPRAVKAAKPRKAAKAKAHREEMASIREQVLARAGDFCEGCGLSHTELQVDHFFGGNGRRRALQSRFTCWALCSQCHHLKTTNQPDAAAWLAEFVRHCELRAHACTDEEDRWGYLDARNMARNRLASLQLQQTGGMRP